MYRGAWQATVHEVTKTQTQLSDYYSLYLKLVTCHPKAQEGIYVYLHIVYTYIFVSLYSRR